MTNVHPRRALAESEAAAWLELHDDWNKGLPAEVRDTSVKGELFHDHLGDGWDNLWFRSAADKAAPTAKPKSTTPRCAVDSDYEQSMPTIERRTVHTGCVGDYGVIIKPPVRIVARTGTELLKETTTVLGQRVPGALTYDRKVQQRGDRCATFAASDFSFRPDSSWMQQLAYDELISWLRLEAELTDKEIESLEKRAAGQAIPDRHCLARAQRKAQAALV